SHEAAVRNRPADSSKSALPVFAARDVRFGYGGAFHLDLAPFDVLEGEILGLVDPNSSGKTTLLRLLSRGHAPDRGEIRFRGRPARWDGSPSPARSRWYRRRSSSRSRSPWRSSP